MKTKIRTQISNSNAMGTAYKHMHIQILTGRYSSKDDSNLEEMGSITFQANSNEPAGYNNWYGMSFVIETDNPNYIKKMAQLAKLIKDKRSDYNAQPDEIIKIIGAEEYVFHDSLGFVPRASYGMGIFKVMVEGKGGTYSSIIAENETEAIKKLKKKNIEGATLTFDKVITF